MKHHLPPLCPLARLIHVWISVVKTDYFFVTHVGGGRRKEDFITKHFHQNKGIGSGEGTAFFFHGSIFSKLPTVKQDMIKLHH